LGYLLRYLPPQGTKNRPPISRELLLTWWFWAWQNLNPASAWPSASASRVRRTDLIPGLRPVQGWPWFVSVVC